MSYIEPPRPNELVTSIDELHRSASEARGLGAPDMADELERVANYLDRVRADVVRRTGCMPVTDGVRWTDEDTAVTRIARAGSEASKQVFPRAAESWCSRSSCGHAASQHSFIGSACCSLCDCGGFQ